MSHITTIKSKITNLEVLKTSLKNLNFDIIENKNGETIKIKSWNKQTIDLENVVLEIKTGTPYNVGVIYNEQEKTYEFVSDWWGIETYTQLNEEKFINKITQRYAYDSVMSKLTEKGYNFIKEEVDDKNNCCKKMELI
jgi:hypothetical protein